MRPNGARPLAAPRFFSVLAAGGWTLIELVIVLVVAAILMYFVVRTFQPKEPLALQQAERLRDDLRHIQMLAITWNQALRLNTAAANYSVSCVTASINPPCNVAPVIDPATGRTYLVTLETGLTLAFPVPPFFLQFDPLGRPKDNTGALIAGNTTFTINGASVARTVVVGPLAGFVTAQ